MHHDTAITIGNFDGVHRGHVELVKTARATVGDDGRVVVVTFDPHPIAILRPDHAPERLCTIDERTRLLHDVGADDVVVIPATRELLAMDPASFVDTVIMPHAPSVIIEGPDFRFGRARAGSNETLRTLGSSRGFETVVLDPIDAALLNQSLVTVSSSMIRWLLRHGRVGDAALLLDRPYTLVGPIVRGDQRGRTIDFPTANLDHGPVMLPADGIYAGFAVRDDGHRYGAAISIGTKPTFGESPRTCEAHLLHYDGPIDEYGWTMRLEFHAWLREQVTYTGAPALIEQLHRDVARTAVLCRADVVSAS